MEQQGEKIGPARWPGLMGFKDAAEYVGLSEKTLRNGCSKNAEWRFPVKPKRIGRRVLFSRKDLDAWIDSLPVDG